jgi:hypothetical protein
MHSFGHFQADRGKVLTSWKCAVPDGIREFHCDPKNPEVSNTEQQNIYIAKKPNVKVRVFNQVNAKQIICLGFCTKTQESAIIMPSSNGDFVLGVCRIGPGCWRTVSFASWQRALPGIIYIKQIFWRTKLLLETFTELTYFSPVTCVCFRNCLILGYGFSEDCDFQNMIYKIVYRSERSITWV